jgi:hypothetical protein
MGTPVVFAVSPAVVSTGDQVLFHLITIGAVVAGFIAVPLVIAGGGSWRPGCGDACADPLRPRRNPIAASLPTTATGPRIERDHPRPAGPVRVSGRPDAPPTGAPGRPPPRLRSAWARSRWL